MKNQHVVLKSDVVFCSSAFYIGSKKPMLKVVYNIDFWKVKNRNLQIMVISTSREQKNCRMALINFFHRTLKLDQTM